MRSLMFFIAVFCLFFLSSLSEAQIFQSPFGGHDIISECDYCGCAQGISPMQTGSTGIRYDVGSLYLGAPYNGSTRLAETGAHESFLTNKITMVYRFAESPITVSLAVPYVVRKSQELVDNGFQAFQGNGIGDVAAFVRYNHHHYVDETMVAFSFSAGVKFPTGKNNITLPSGDYLDPDLQPGTGTTDFIIGTAGFLSIDRTGIFATVNAGFITGPGAPESDGNHKYGNYINAEATVTYRIIPQDISESNLSLAMGIGFENRAKETEGGIPIEASGGSLIYLAPGLKYLFSQGLSADAAIQIPVHQYLGADPLNDEFQLGQDYRFVMGIQYSL